MHSFFGRRTVVWTCLVALGLAAAAPAGATKPEPGKKGFRLFARAGGSIRVNQVQCGLLSDGQICVDSTGSSTIPGSVWPKGTNNQYTFNSGISVAGIIGPELPAWAGDTTGAFFFDGGGQSNAEQVFPIFNASDPVDLADWPDYARVPSPPDPGADIFDPLLQGAVSASQGDVWFMSWDGNPTALSGRSHPLGVAVETRGLAWNFPSGNQDILYFVYTLYNITSTREADYASVRPALRTELLRKAADFQAANEAAFGIDIPEGGYTQSSVFMDFAADQDVTVDAGANYATFNNLFNLAITYHEVMLPAPGNTFDPALHAPPFMPGPGFVGTKYLRSPILPDGTEAGTVLAGLTTNRGSFPDPGTLTQLYRYISNNVNPAAGDPQCNTGDPRITHICFINDQPSDTRTFQSSGPLELPPGGQATIVVAYIFAAPLASGKCPSIPCPVTMTPAPLIVNGATPSNPGVNAIDSMMGWRGFALGTPEDSATQDSVVVVPNSLLAKAKVAQNIFDTKFLLPFAPASPDFFVVPGNGQVTVLWRPSATETEGDAYFGLASDPTKLAYDPAYRQFDVEGYRVYRGRTDSPNTLTLLAQFDKAGTQIFDFRGFINPTPDCAPELEIVAGCAVPFGPPPPGGRFPDSVGVALNGEIVQIKVGGRKALADGTAILTASDTAVTGGASGFAALSDNGVPFAFTDDGTGGLGVSAPRNNVRYFYSVTAFDVNSFASGPSSLESQRVTRPATPVVGASNASTSSTITRGFFGRDVEITDTVTPTIDPTTGIFSKKFPVADGATFDFLGQLLSQLFTHGSGAKVQLTGIGLGDGRNGVPAHYTYTTFSDADTATADIFLDSGTGFGVVTVGSSPFPAALADPSLAATFGASSGQTTVAGQVNFSINNYQVLTGQGRGCNGEGGAGLPGANNDAACAYNGPRWFSGDNETQADPNFGLANDATGAGVVPGTNLNNAGALPGVTTIQVPLSYGNVSADWRVMEATLYAPIRAADMNVYWGPTPGKIDSVIDVTHNVPVPFMPDSMGGGFGILNAAASANGSDDGRATVVTLNDLSCVEPWRSGAAGAAVAGTWPVGCTSPAGFLFSDQAELNQIALYSGGLDQAATAPVRPNPGFLLYIAGRISLIELAGATLPTNVVWTLRSYTGVVNGGHGAGGDLGPYSFVPVVRPNTALGSELQINFEVENRLANAETGDLRRVHTVPDPYYVTSGFEVSATDKVIKFVNLPARAIIRIYSSSGVLVSVLEHNSAQLQGDETWNVRNRNNQVVASGVYFYHIEAGDARRVGRFTVVNFAQ
jgi:hypothetical protein